MVKKALFVIFILFSSISGLFAANSKGITLSIQGSGTGDLIEGFKYALRVEASAAGYDLTDNIAGSKFYIKFSSEFDQVQQKSKITVALVRTADSYEIVSMEYLFTDEEEMLLYSQLVFFMLMANLPEDELSPVAALDNSWRDKWLYLRVSIDYSIMILELRKTNRLMWNSTNPSTVAPLDNKVVPVLGIGLGAEVQVLNFLSLEPGAQISYERVVEGHEILNLLLTMSVKFPLKFFDNFVPEPYIMAAFPMRFQSPLSKSKEEIFSKGKHPGLAFGGGVQVAVKMEKNSAIFFEASYLYYGDVALKNQYPPLYDRPENIIYNYSVVCFKVGYKYGLFDRKKKGS